MALRRFVRLTEVRQPPTLLVKDAKMLSTVEYCDTLHAERGEKHRIQNIPKESI